MKRNWVLWLLVVISSGVHGQKTMGIFTNSQDIGAVHKTGTTTYDGNEQIFEISGAGANIWFDKDEFQFAYKKTSGNFYSKNSSQIYW
ncbi:hypothetical protein Q2T40_01705 [Winogradskyella maritima]|nr:hypothetical protein [Winogradskyella maritima]